MKNLINSFRAAPLGEKASALVQVLAWVFVIGLLATEARAQSGNVYAPNQAQTSGDVWPAQVLQVALREVEPSNQARVAGAAVGGALGLALASRSNSRHGFAVNTLGAVVGGLLGERSASAIASNAAQEIILKVQPPGQPERVMIVVQPAPFDAVVPGEQVFLSIVNGAFRVIRRGGLL